MTMTDDQVIWNTSDAGSESDWLQAGHPAPGLNDNTSQVPIFREGAACVDGQINVAAGTFTENIFTGVGDLSNGIRAHKLYVIWLWMTSNAAYDGMTDILVGINDTTAWGGTAWGQWDMKPLFQSIDRGGWVPCAVYPTQPDFSGAGFNTIALASIDSQRVDVDNLSGSQVRLFGIEQSFAISYLGGHSQTVTLDNLVTHSKDKTTHRDSGMINSLGATYRSQVVIRLGDAGATGTTNFSEQSKIIHWDNVNSDHEIGLNFLNATGGAKLNFQLGNFLGNSPVSGVFMFWNSGASDVFIGPQNCDTFRIYAGTILKAGPVELPPHVTSKGSVADLVTIGAGGTGYAVDDVLTATSGTGTKATFTVTAVSTGAVTAITQTTEGDYTVDPTNPSATTVAPAGGTGATLNITTRFFKECKGYVFDSSGEVDIGDLIFEDNKILNAVSGVLIAGDLSAAGVYKAKDNAYIGCTDAMHFDTAQTLTLDGDKFSGNTTDIHFSGAGTLTINLINNANAVTSRVTGGGTVSINNTVTLTVQVNDTDGVAVNGAKVRIERTSDGSLVVEGSTNASGTFSDSTFNFSSNLSIQTKVRLKGFKFFRTSGTITSSGLSVGVRFESNKIVDLP